MKQYDPYMHTAEHVLNKTMVRLFDCERSFSSHLERRKSKCDYHFPRALMPEEEAKIEKEVNLQLSRNMPVEEHWLAMEEAALKYNLTKLPEETTGKIRIVTIGDFDACPCIGDHVCNTSEAGTFILGSTSFDEGVLRIRFKLKRG